MTFQTMLLQPAPAMSGPAMYLAETAQDALSTYGAGSEIYGQGELAGPIYAVEFGCVRIGRLTPEGKRQVCGFSFGGDVFGWECGREHRFFAEAVGVTGIRVLRPNRDAEAAAKLFPLVVQSLTRFQEHLLVLGKTIVDERLAAFLCDLAARQGAGSRIELPMARNDIADYLGVSFETVSRILRRFRDQGLIRVPDIHSIEILDRATLEAICGHEADLTPVKASEFGALSLQGDAQGARSERRNK
ncbi:MULTISPECIES: helix-turn-helix domain-containing protein [unclassified Devosia]|uniref:helix-turn-helix domain-containing protein n=1 Tax=unclassified Devosia TaxID=196773 RepID=UPI000FDBE21C|nr:MULTISPECIES: helix-turn-helix domain-containing protein [unclassified Devosia]